MKPTVDTRFVELLAEKVECPVDDLDLNGTLEELGLDSLHLMEIAMWIRKEFGVDIPEGELRHDLTAREGLEYLTGKVS